jgi:hypothetical protein
MKIENMRGIIFVGVVVFLSYSVICNYIFFSSFTDDPEAQKFYRFWGVILNFAQVAFAITMSYYLYVLASHFYAILSGIGWIALVCVSIIASFGVFTVTTSESENKALLASNQYIASQNAVTQAQETVNKLSTGANKSQAMQAQSNIDTLKNNLNSYLKSPAYNMANNKVGTIQTRIKGCQGTNYYQRTYCPKVNDIREEIAKNLIIVAKFSRYEAAQSALAQRQLELAKISSGDNVRANGHIHSSFISMGRWLEVSPVEAKDWFFMRLALLGEFAGNLFFLLLGRVMSFSGNGITSRERVYNATPNQTEHTDYKENACADTQNDGYDTSVPKSLTHNNKDVGSEKYVNLTKKLRQGIVKPTCNHLKGYGLSVSLIKAYQKEWSDKDYIEPSKYNNLNTFKLKESARIK